MRGREGISGMEDSGCGKRLASDDSTRGGWGRELGREREREGEGERVSEISSRKEARSFPHIPGAFIEHSHLVCGGCGPCTRIH